MQIAGERTAAAKEHYDVAVLSYGEARDLLEPASPTQESLQAAGAALEKGLRAARRTRAVLEGRSVEAADQEPLLEGMCSFDPKHGKAVTTVEITTPSGEKATLPACATCAADMAAGPAAPFPRGGAAGPAGPLLAERRDGHGPRRRAWAWAAAGSARCSAAPSPG